MKHFFKIFSAVIVMVMLAVFVNARISSPDLENSINGADAVIICKTLSAPEKKTVVCYRCDYNGKYKWDLGEGLPVSAITNVLERYVELSRMYAKQNKEEERAVVDNTLSRYFWVWETPVAVSNVITGDVTGSTIIVRQMLPYTGVYEDSVPTEKLKDNTSYILFLWHCNEGVLSDDKYELPMYYVAYPVAEKYPVLSNCMSSYTNRSYVSHKDLLMMIKNRTFRRD